MVSEYRCQYPSMSPLTRFVSMLIPILLLVSGICTLPVTAAEHTVAMTGAEFVSVQDAVDWATTGDTILVESGTYNETIILNKKIILVGIDSGGGLPVIDAGQTGDGIDIRVDGCTVEHFVIRNGSLFTGIRVASGDNSIRKNAISGFGQGIFLLSSRGSTISDNNIFGNDRVGIAFESSDNNIVENNIVTRNTIGITLDEYALSNIITYNTFSNSQNVVSKSKTSQWSSPDSFTYTYLGQKQQSRMGNYWSDYTGRDRNGDGIGDTAYTITTGVNPNAVLETFQNVVDPFPLMDPTEFYTGISSPLPPATPGRQQPPVTNPQSVEPGTPAASPKAVPAWLPLLWPAPTSGAMPVLLAILLIMAAVAGFFFLSRWRVGVGKGTHPESAVPPVPGSPEPGVSAAGNGDPIRKTPPSFVAWLTDRIRGYVTGMTSTTKRVALAGAAVTIPITSRAAELLRTVVSDRSGSPPSSTGPVPRTARPENLEPPAVVPAPEQKNYFPRELESKYTEIAYLGRGGIAWVFSARRKSDGIRVAVKIPISFDETTGKCFLNEIAAWETLRHENIVEVTAVNILPVPYVEMEFVPGSLEALEKPLPVWKAVHIVNGITAGLQYAHEHGFIHRDIKPHNILLTDAVVPKITDWGMSKVLAADIKKSSIAGFSLSYAAPEQVSPSEFGRTGERTDIYQLGVVFYELVTGSIPFGGESIVEVGNAILRETPIPPSEYNPDAEAVEKIVLKCLEKDPARRYQSAAELLDALAGYLDEDEG